ncbi:MAG: hypothetical protein K6G79_04885 [Bacteroidales bacterium]|nr:hypothetical protein [Bacteroidales bacterium]
MNDNRPIDSPAALVNEIRRYGIIPFFKCGVRGWSVEELTAPGCWIFEDDEAVLGPWDWKIDAVREGDIAYGKFLGGKAAFATVEWYRELMNWRRSLPRWRMALGERYKVSTQGDRLMKILAPMALDAIRTAGCMEMKELRTICAQKLTPGQLKSAGTHYRPMLQPTVKKSVMDSVIQFLQMGTWSVIGDFERVYRGPDMTYNGWQRASNTTPEDLFAVPDFPGVSSNPDSSLPVPDPGPEFIRIARILGPSADLPAAEPGPATASLAATSTPAASRARLIAHILEFFPSADPRVLEKLI